MGKRNSGFFSVNMVELLDQCSHIFLSFVLTYDVVCPLLPILLGTAMILRTM